MHFMSLWCVDDEEKTIDVAYSRLVPTSYVYTLHRRRLCQAEVWTRGDLTKCNLQLT